MTTQLTSGKETLSTTRSMPQRQDSYSADISNYLNVGVSVTFKKVNKA